MSSTGGYSSFIYKIYYVYGILEYNRNENFVEIYCQFSKIHVRKEYFFLNSFLRSRTQNLYFLGNKDFSFHSLRYQL